MPKVGSVLRITLPGDVTRRAKILEYDRDLMVLVEWVDYDLPVEWIPTHQL